MTDKEELTGDDVTLDDIVDAEIEEDPAGNVERALEDIDAEEEEAGPLDGEEYSLNIQYALSNNREFWTTWLKARIRTPSSRIYAESETKAAKDLSAAIRGVMIIPPEVLEDL